MKPEVAAKDVAGSGAKTSDFAGWEKDLKKDHGWELCEMSTHMPLLAKPLLGIFDWVRWQIEWWGSTSNFLFQGATRETGVLWRAKLNSSQYSFWTWESP